MKILDFVVRVECDDCAGKGHVHGGQREHGELVSCAVCGGHGWRNGVVSFEEFAKLIRKATERLWKVYP